MKRVLFLVLAFIIAIALFPTSALANDSMIVGGTGGTVYAISNSDVEMEEEIIDILVKDGKTYVSCQFFFHNTGKKTTLMMGFPTEIEDYRLTRDEDYEPAGEEDHDDTFITDLNGFKTYIRGKRIPVRIKSGLKPEGNNPDNLYFPKWYTWKVKFAADERVKVVNKYWAVNSGATSHEWEEINYILRSGSTWKGTIGKVTVRLRFRGYNPSGVTFEEWQPSYIEEDGTIVWKAENLEPQEDIRVFHNDNYDFWEQPQNPYDTINGNEADYDAYYSMSLRMLKNFKAKHYNGTTWWGNRFLRRFGDTQSEQFYYVMGVSYYKLGRYEKALEMLENVQDAKSSFYDSSYYYKARAYSKVGDKAGFRKYVDYLSSSEFEWLKLWAQSRLKDMEAALDNGVMLKDIAAFLNMSEEELDEKYKDNIEWVRFNDSYSEYLYDDMGINLVCYCNDSYSNNKVKYIELDRDKISFRGIDSSMNFKEVMSILGETEVLAFEDGLPGLKTYELRYEFDGIKVRIYSWDKDGNSGIYMSVVDDYLPEYRPIRITPKQICHYFDLTKEELEKELGEGETPWDSTEWVDYPQYGASFRYDEQGKWLYAMNLDANYQINDLKVGISLKDAMKIMGKRKIEEWETSEDGTMSEITYRFRNFRLQISSLESEGWQGYWDIMSEKFYGGNRYS